MTEPARTLTNEELIAVAALWKRTGREFVTRFTGTSMQPTIADGASVRLLCTDVVSVGDVVAYVYGDRVIVHRIVAIWSDRFVTRGDASVLPDPMLLERNDIIGKGAPWPLVAPPVSLVASLVLTFSTFIARIAGNRTSLRLLGVLRTAHRRLRMLGRSFSATRATFGSRLRSWQYRDFNVYYRGNLDGQGSVLAQPFTEFVRARQNGQTARRAFEWCAGPGFIGFSLLAEGLCDSLCLADINPAATRCVQRTIRKNHLERRASVYTSDNFAAIPHTEKFDLVVANPPNYYNLNPAHPLHERFKDDLRPNDRGWKIHEEFYRTVSEYLLDGAMLYILVEVTIPGCDVPYDIRPRQPIEDFKRMIASGGLTYVSTAPLTTSFGFRGDIVISTKAGSSKDDQPATAEIPDGTLR